MVGFDIVTDLDQVWNWLPAFLAVAEHGSAAAASKSLGLTPAAVSRTVRLLEDRLGRPLFHRVGRRLELNEAGRVLRDSVRTANSSVTEGLRGLSQDRLPTMLRVASLGVLTDALVVPTLIELLETFEGVVPEHRNLRPSEALPAVRRYELDAALYYEELTEEALEVARLGEIGASVYCGVGHALFAATAPGVDDVLEHPFSVPQIGDSGQVMDGWPSALARKVGMRVTLLRSNLEVALSGRLLVVLPDITAEPHVEAGALRRLDAPALPRIEVFMARRAGPAGPVLEWLVERVQAKLSAGARPASQGKKP